MSDGPKGEQILNILISPGHSTSPATSRTEDNVVGRSLLNEVQLVCVSAAFETKRGRGDVTFAVFPPSDQGIFVYFGGNFVGLVCFCLVVKDRFAIYL